MSITCKRCLKKTTKYIYIYIYICNRCYLVCKMSYKDTIQETIISSNPRHSFTLKIFKYTFLLYNSSSLSLSHPLSPSRKCTLSSMVSSSSSFSSSSSILLYFMIVMEAKWKIKRTKKKKKELKLENHVSTQSH